jgi:hypothetical protein
MSDESDSSKPVGFKEIGADCTASDVIQSLVPSEIEIAERLTAIWREWKGDHPTPPGRSLLDLRSLLIEHKFQTEDVDLIALALANLIALDMSFRKMEESARKIKTSDIDEFRKILVEAENVLQNPPISVSVSRGKSFVEKAERENIVKKASIKNNKLILIDADEDWKKLVSSVRSNLRVIISHAEAFAKENSADLGGRPKNGMKVGFVGSLLSMWSAGTRKEANLSTQMYSFSHFAHDVCCCYPVKFTEGETKWAIRQAVAQSEIFKKDKMIFDIADALRNPPHNLTPEAAREMAIKSVNHHIAKQKGRSRSGAARRT